MTALRVLIVDDEPPARDLLRALLAEHDDVTVVAEANNGRQAVAAIRRHRPDLVFLDVQMPELDGFGVIEAVGSDRMPAVVFVTAYDRYAVRAFESEAVDYLLKPFDAERLATALRRAAAGELGRRLEGVMHRLRADRPAGRRLPVSRQGVVRFVEVDAIDWIEADGKHAILHTGRETHVVTETLAAVEARLEPDRFLRIHRSIVVNVDRIREVQPWFQGGFVLILQDGTRLTSGPTYRRRLLRLIGRATASDA